MAAIRRISSLVFCDVETTGLPRPQIPHRITELSFCAVDRLHFLGGKAKELPRVSNRLNLCFDPNCAIHPIASKMTLLDNPSLVDQNPFDNHAFNIVKNFLNRLKPPVCLIAHNGNGFDFPLLKSEVEKLGERMCEDLLCVDSLPIFREKFPKEKNDLGSIYHRIYQEKPNSAHAAEADVFTLLFSTTSMPTEFLNLAETNAIPFKNIKSSW